MISMSDIRFAPKIFVTWLDSVALNRTNIRPEDTLWTDYHELNGGYIGMVESDHSLLELLCKK